MNLYEKAKKDFCKDNPGLQIYQVGEVSHPGISDLDFIVLDREPVVRDSVKEMLCDGNIIIMPSFCIDKINLIEDFNITLLQGDKIALREYDSRNFRYIEILEWLPERILLLESIQKNMNSAPVRKKLLYLKSINRSIEKVESLTGILYPRVSQDELRCEADSYQIDKAVDHFLFTGLLAWNDFSRSFSHIIGEASGAADICSYYKFEDRFNCLVSYFNIISKENGFLGREISSRVDVWEEKIHATEEFKMFSLRRGKLISEIFEWFRSEKIKNGMVKYGWFL